MAPVGDGVLDRSDLADAPGLWASPNPPHISVFFFFEGSPTYQLGLKRAKQPERLGCLWEVRLDDNLGCRLNDDFVT